jgi:hypothetical protein
MSKKSNGRKGQNSGRRSGRPDGGDKRFGEGANRIVDRTEDEQNEFEKDLEWKRMKMNDRKGYPYDENEEGDVNGKIAEDAEIGDKLDGEIDEQDEQGVLIGAEMELSISDEEETYYEEGDEDFAEEENNDDDPGKEFKPKKIPFPENG